MVGTVLPGRGTVLSTVGLMRGAEYICCMCYKKLPKKPKRASVGPRSKKRVSFGDSTTVDVLDEDEVVGELAFVFSVVFSDCLIQIT